MALSQDQNVTLNFYFGGHFFIFQAKITHKIGLFKATNNSQTTSKQIQNNIQKAHKTDLLSLIIVEMVLSMSQNCTYNLILDVIYRTFELKSLLKFRFLMSKIIPKQLTSEQLQTNLQKVQKDFFGSKNDQIMGNNFGKSVDFFCVFWI